MGGKAFSTGSDALYTPRMPKHVYLSMKTWCIEILRNEFEEVDCPIEGPEKEDFGDLDILLYGPKKPGISPKEVLENIQRLLNATRTIVDSWDPVAAHLAIPWPQEDSSASRMDDSGQLETRHIQVDIQVCATQERMEWHLFKHAHGDLWNVIGSTIRPYGLTVDEEGMWIRIEEMEKVNKKRSKVFLTSDTSEILKFLGLSSSVYWNSPFINLQDMFAYVAQCRMFSVSPEHGPDRQFSDKEGHDAEDRARLRSNDRRRMNQRPAFRAWIDEFIPECRRQGEFLQKRSSRPDIKKEAFATFGVKDEYDNKLWEFLLEQQTNHIWNNVIKESIPEPDDKDRNHSLQVRSGSLKAYKRIILESDDSYGITRPDNLKGEDGFYIVENVLAFIERTKTDVERIVTEKINAAYKKRMEVKEKKTRLAMEEQ